jgi:beta-glucosidase
MIDGQPDVPKSVIDSKEHRELTYESGLKSLVLLKNADTILPLDKSAIKSIALIGPNAAVLPLDGHSSSAVIPSYTIPVKIALDSLLGANRVKYIQGCTIKGNDKNQFTAALEAAKKSDYVIFVGGLDSTIEGEGYFIGGDRIGGTTRLPGVQNELINALAKVNPNIILVIISGGTCSVNPVIDNVKGLIYAFYPGQEAGRAIADVLLGNYNPSGKLPVTMPKSDEQLPERNMDFTNVGTEGVGYRWYDSQKLQPEYAFGYGLSYTDFKYSDLKLSSPVARAGEQIEVLFNITNTGRIAGEEVAQVYLSAVNCSPQIPMAVKQLKGFSKVMIEPGQTKTIRLSLTPDEFYTYNESLKTYQVAAGEYLIKVGGSSDNLPLQASLKLTESPGKPDLLVKNIRTMPAFPKEGDEVVFLVSLLNRGTAPTKPGDHLQLSFFVDGEEVAVYSSTKLCIPAGGMELICSEGKNGFKFKAKKGKYNVTAKVDQRNLIKETNENNNILECIWTIPDGRVINKEFQMILDPPQKDESFGGGISRTLMSL